QTFAGTLIDVGPALVSATSGSGGTADLFLGALSHNAGGFVDFIPPASATGNIHTTSTNSNGTTGAANGILGASAVIQTVSDNNRIRNNVTQGNEVASVDAAGNIVPYTGYTAYSAGDQLSLAAYAGKNVQKSGASALAIPVSSGSGVTVDLNTIAIKN